MTDVTLNRTAARTYEDMKPADPGYCPGRRDLLAFAQTSLNVAPTMRNDLQITNSVCNIGGQHHRSVFRYLCRRENQHMDSECVTTF